MAAIKFASLNVQFMWQIEKSLKLKKKKNMHFRMTKSFFVSMMQILMKFFSESSSLPEA